LLKPPMLALIAVWCLAATMTDATVQDPAARNLGIAHDSVTVAEQGVAVGFGIAKFATNLGFDIASVGIKAPAQALEKAAGPNVISSGLHGLGSVVSFAHGATRAGQELAHGITRASLGATKLGLTAAGAQEGELLRLAAGEEAAEIVFAIQEMVRKYVEPLSSVPPEKLLAAASAWSAVQRAAGIGASSGQQAALPEHTERWMRFAAATFGASWLAGLVDLSFSAAAQAREVAERGGSPGEAALAWAGVEGHIEILEFEQGSNRLFQPGYLVAVDHVTGHVVVALRGTSSVRDALSDLACQPSELQLGGMSGLAHSGMLIAARRIEGRLADMARIGLDSLGIERPRIVVVGHSLGAGVGALVTALWRDQGSFPGVDVRCVALACPQILDEDLSRAVSNFTTSIVLGDDLVPRFSLATANDLRSAVLHINDPVAHGLDPSFASQLLACQHLAQLHGPLRQAACTAQGRLFPAGRLIHIVEGRPQEVQALAFDELIISQDMAAAHMPQRYLKAVQEASRDHSL